MVGKRFEKRVLEMISIIKKDNTREDFNVQKVVNAVNKSATRVMYKFTPDELNFICKYVTDKAQEYGEDEIPIAKMHNIVEGALEATNPAVAKSYKDYRNYKQDFVHMLDEVYVKSQSIMYIGDKENSNSDSALVSTKRSLIFNELNKELYKKFFMTAEELQACRDGYIYVHDMSARRDTMNCCLFDMKNLLTGGFFMGNLDYLEPKSLDVAFDLIGDVTLNAAASQYGGFTIPEIDKLLAPYAAKSYKIYFDEYVNITRNACGKDGKPAPLQECTGLLERADKYATDKVRREFEQGFQSWEMKFNSVASSRGDYPFTALTFGLGTGKWESMASSVCMKVRADG